MSVNENHTPKNIFVTGANGFIGGCVADVFELDGASVFRMTREAHGDLTSPSTTGDLFADKRKGKYDVVVHAAASFSQNPDEAYKVNCTASRNLFLAAEATGCGLFLYISSIFALSPELGVYAQTKLDSELMLRELAEKSGTKLVIVRPSQVYDSFGRAAVHQGMLYFTADRIARGETVSLFGSTDPERNFIHVNDLIRALVGIVSLATSHPTAGESIIEANCTHPSSITFGKLVPQLIELTQSKSKVIVDQTKPDPFVYKILHEPSVWDMLGLAPAKAIEQELVKYIELKRKVP